MHDLFQDIRFALRTLRKRPDFTAVALITLALGIGANSAIFSVVQTVLLEPLPFEEPDRLVQIWESRLDRGWDRASVAPGNFWDLRDMNRTFEDLGVFSGASMNLTGSEFPERISAGRVSAGFFSILGVAPVLGRTLLIGEDDPGQDNQVALLGNSFWQSHYGGDGGVLNQTLMLDGRSYTIVGVLPRGEPWLNYGDVFIPYVRNPDATRVSFEVAVIGRLSPGVDFDTALADLGGIADRLAESFPEQLEGIGIAMGSSDEWIADDNLRLALVVLFAAVGCLLLIACVNIANLLMARATARHREMALRAALGAGRSRIIRQVITESLLIGFIGSGLGLLLAGGVIRLIQILEPQGIPRIADIGLNGTVLGFTILVGLLAGVFSGLFPALQIPYASSAVALRAGDRASAGSRGAKRLRNVLVAAEIALSLILLIGAGLLVRSFGQLLGVDRGFATENRLVFSVTIPDDWDGDRHSQLRNDFLDRIQSMPQVISAAAVNIRPLIDGSTGMGILPEGHPPEAEAEIPWASWRMITPDYFESIGIPLVRGRTFAEDEIVGNPWRVIISERLAEEMWPGEDPIGRTALLWKGQGDRPAEVIGVVGDMAERGLADGPTRATYIPYRGANWSPMHLVVHTAAAPEAIVPDMRAILADIHPDLPISNVTNMEEMVGISVAARRFNMLLLTIFSGVALFLALAGIFGVQSYSVTRQTAEIGVRVALGANRGQVLGHIIRGGMRPAIIGVAVGIVGALLLSRLMSTLLFGIGAGDPMTYLAVAVILTLAAYISCYLPARRALRIDPVVALRQE
ncbi:ABC transporter permease [Gemmatimonadota bacterium]